MIPTQHTFKVRGVERVGVTVDTLIYVMVSPSETLSLK